MKLASLWALTWITLSMQAASLGWHWSNPLPFGNDVVGLAWQTNLAYIAVCDHGRLYSSADLLSWSSVDSGTTNDFQAATYFGTRLVAVGANGLAWWADDLAAPQAVSLATTNWLVALASSPGLVVAVGDNAAIYTSTNGAAWAKVTPGFTESLRSVAWSGSMFAAVGEKGRIATSPNGAVWTTHPSGVTGNLNSVAWTGSSFLAVGDAGLVLQSGPGGGSWQRANNGGSTADLACVASGLSGVNLVGGYGQLWIDATVWLDQTATAKASPAPVTDYYALLWDGAEFVAAGEAGETVVGLPGSPGFEYDWTPYASPPRTWLFDAATVAVTATNVSVAFTNGAVSYATNSVANALYVLVGDQGEILNSDDGVDWVSASTPTNSISGAFFAVAGNSSGLLAVGAAGGAAFSAPNYVPLVTTNTFTNRSGPVTVVLTNLSPTLGSVWTKVASPTTGSLEAAAASDSLFVVAGDGGFIATSPDAKTWTPRNSTVSTVLSGLVAWPNGFVAVGNNGVVLDSTNGISWRKHSLPTTNWIYKVRWCGGKLVAVGESGVVYTSADGASWTLQTTGVTNWLNDVAWVNGAFYAAGDQGVVLSSTNAVNWTRDTNVFTYKSFYTAAAMNNQLIVAGYEGVILRAATAPFTNAVQVVSWPESPTNHVFLFSGVVDQVFNFERSTDLTNWAAEVTLGITDSSGSLAFVDGASNSVVRQYYRTVTVP